MPWRGIRFQGRQAEKMPPRARAWDRAFRIRKHLTMATSKRFQPLQTLVAYFMFDHSLYAFFAGSESPDSTVLIPCLKYRYLVGMLGSALSAF